MKLSDLKRKTSKKEEDGSQPRRNRRLLIELALKLILMFMVIIAILYGIGAAIFGSSLIIPRDAVGVLDSTKEPVAYRWTSESLRRLQIHDHKESQAASRSAAVQTGNNRFFAVTFGASRTPVAYISDGKKTIQMSNSDVASATDRRDGTLLTDACAAINRPRTETTTDDGAIPAELLAMPSAEMLKAGDPSIVTDKGTFLGQRAWVLSVDPTAEIVKQLLWVGFLDRAMQAESFASDRLWIMGDEERKALDEGNYEVLKDSSGRPWSFVWVTRDDRRIAQFDIRIRIDLGEEKSSEYRLFSHIAIDDKKLETEELDLGETTEADCR